MMLRDEGAKGLEMTGMTSPEAGDARLEKALGDFRASIHAWSEARMRTFSPAVVLAPHVVAWRRTVAWAIGVVLAVGAASGAVYERHRQQILAREAEQRQVELEQRAQAARRAADMDQLLANVDRDVSQEVPDALEPLARMMTDGGSSK